MKHATYSLFRYFPMVAIASICIPFLILYFSFRTNNNSFISILFFSTFIVMGLISLINFCAALCRVRKPPQLIIVSALSIATINLFDFLSTFVDIREGAMRVSYAIAIEANPLSSFMFSFRVNDFFVIVIALMLKVFLCLLFFALFEYTFVAFVKFNCHGPSSKDAANDADVKKKNEKTSTLLPKAIIDFCKAIIVFYLSPFAGDVFPQYRPKPIRWDFLFRVSFVVFGFFILKEFSLLFIVINNICQILVGVGVLRWPASTSFFSVVNQVINYLFMVYVIIAFWLPRLFLRFFKRH